MKIIVVDGQGGGIGSHIVEKTRHRFATKVNIVALGTNALATSAMIKAGADKGATGENAIIRNIYEADLITGSIGIISANSMLGELTPKMAEAIGSSKALKLLLPMNRCGIEVMGGNQEPIPVLIEEMLDRISELMK